jgi:hypothetical protein
LKIKSFSPSCSGNTNRNTNKLTRPICEQKYFAGSLAAGIHRDVSACALALNGIEPRLEAPRDRSGSSDLYATARGS